MVSQETTLFDDKIKNNIAYANLDATQKEIEEAAKFSFADEFINKLPDKYETMIGENGIRLSGGDKQRLSIARAILKDPKLLLLDEATSALDSVSEAAVQAALTNLMKGRTSLVIAHRLSTIIDADRILLLEKGYLVAEGTHDDLLATSPLYRELALHQFG